MSAAVPGALDFCLALTHVQAGLARRLDDDLGAFHGLNFGDFTLLYLLMRSDHGRLPMPGLAHSLGLPMSALIRKMVLLEKTGLAERVAGPDNDARRHAALRPGGRRLVQDAVATVEAHCKEALRPVEPECLRAAHTALVAMSAMSGDNPPHGRAPACASG